MRSKVIKLVSLILVPLFALTGFANSVIWPDSSGCLEADTQQVVDGQPINYTISGYDFTVGQIPSSWWKNPPMSDASAQLYLRGFGWAQRLGQRAFNDGQYQALSVIINQVIAFNTQNPDPGTSEYGWDEGTTLRRLESINCLYWLAKEAGLSYGYLKGSMNDNVAVLLGPRYYGPPYKAVHNHGLLANLRVLRAGVLRDVSSWRTTAIDRMVYESPLSWSSRGISWEQSSTYHKHNIDLWNQAADAIEEQVPSSSAPDSIREQTRKAAIMLQWMTEPDGNIVKVGDSDDEAGILNPRNYATALSDPEAGWIFGRWSWSDPNTTYYTLRYGPPTKAHGHQDRPCVTFSTLGTRVLVGVGRYTYTEGSWQTWQDSPQGQNCSYTADTLKNSEVKLIGSKVQTTAHAWTTEDTQFGRTHRRTVNVNGSTNSMRVIDSYSGTGTHWQTFHLDPAWQHAGGGVFTHPSGNRLTITTTGIISSVIRGVENSTGPVGGWVFPKRSVKIPAYQVYIRSNTGMVDTILNVD